MSKSRMIAWGGNQYRCDQDEVAITIWQAEDDLFSLPGTDWTDEQIRSVIVVHCLARHRGVSEGKADLRCDLRRLIGAADECHEHDGRMP